MNKWRKRRNQIGYACIRSSFKLVLASLVCSAGNSMRAQFWHPTVAHKGHYALCHNMFRIIKYAFQIMHNTFRILRNTFRIHCKFWNLRDTFQNRHNTFRNLHNTFAPGPQVLAVKKERLRSSFSFLRVESICKFRLNFVREDLANNKETKVRDETRGKKNLSYN